MKFKRILQCLLIACSAMIASLPAQAAMVGTAQMQANPTTIALGDVSAQREWIRQQLVQGGVEQNLAVTRVAAMTDSQVAQIHQRIEQAPAGAGAEVLIIIGLILVITEITGYTDIFPNWPAE